MSPYILYGAGLALFGLSVVTGGLWWAAGVVLVVWAHEARARREQKRAVNEMRERYQRFLHRTYAD